MWIRTKCRKTKKYSLNRRKKIVFVQPPDFSKKILNILTNLKDDYHSEIFKRVSGAIDLVSLSAKYHDESHLKLIHCEEKLKLPSDKYTDKIDWAMNEIFNYMLTSDECQFSTIELLDVVKSIKIISHEDTINSTAASWIKRISCFSWVFALQLYHESVSISYKLLEKHT